MIIQRSQRWHVVRSSTQQQIMDDLSGLNFSNASVSSFLVSVRDLSRKPDVYTLTITDSLMESKS